MTPQSRQSNGQPIGYQVTRTYCRACAPEGLREFHEPMREGDDHGVPYCCDTCDEPLLPCDHEWGPWHRWYTGEGSFRACTRDYCSEIERSAEMRHAVA